MMIRERLGQYACLMRLDKPIGILLLLWPTLWALWLSGAGNPDRFTLLVFIGGVVLMRSAGCVMNDMADRHVDSHVWRTKQRPLVTGQVQPFEALILFVILSLSAFALVLLCNVLTIILAGIGLMITILYPFLKRITHLPQVGVGIAFTWGVPMAFAAQTGSINSLAWFLFSAGVVWAVIYDTMYAMADRDDDLKIGVKSTAILFSNGDRFIVGLLQILFITMLVTIGSLFQLAWVYYACLIAVVALCLYQQWLIKDRHPSCCFRAFLNNSWVGLAIFIGIVASY
jgi:4-hydroxybenzoate polyprenyltransferase